MPIGANQREKFGQCWDYESRFDYWMQYYDVMTNPRWWTTANMKIIIRQRIVQLSQKFVRRRTRS